MSLIAEGLRRFLFADVFRLEFWKLDARGWMLDGLAAPCTTAARSATPPVLLRVEKIKSLVSEEIWRFLLPGVLRVEFWKLEAGNWMLEGTCNVPISICRASECFFKGTLPFFPLHGNSRVEGATLRHVTQDRAGLARSTKAHHCSI